MIMWEGTQKFYPSLRIYARYRNYDETYDYSNLDVYSRMYPALSEIQEYLDKGIMDNNIYKRIR